MERRFFERVESCRLELTVLSTGAFFWLLPSLDKRLDDDLWIWVIYLGVLSECETHALDGWKR